MDRYVAVRANDPACALFLAEAEVHCASHLRSGLVLECRRATVKQVPIVLAPVSRSEDSMLFESNPTPADKAAMQAIDDLVNAKKLSDVKKICKKAVITQTAFADFIMACDSGVLRPWIHQISYRDFMPNWQWTDEDAKKIGDVNNGPLTETQTKAMRKWYQLLSERRYLVGHIFYLPDHSNWQFFYFDNRDLWQYENHFIGGPHVHLINHLWPNRTAESVWNEFRNGNPDMKGAEHIRFDRPYEGPPQI